ncbi:MAG TPA: hypothetical protein VK186_20325 [Candidatus Deferrimicrobium sp.]|nr:hypothetical protein [Candidatus Deferrimicrobium sp.]
MAENWNRSWESTMRTLKNSEQIKVDRVIRVYTGQRTYHFNGLDVLPVDVFLKELYQGMGLFFNKQCLVFSFLLLFSPFPVSHLSVILNPFNNCKSPGSRGQTRKFSLHKNPFF